MLLFIPDSSAGPCRPVLVSIHHMLLFIQKVHFSGLIDILFQYITCYSLSRLICAAPFLFASFQYITCYSLSWTIYRYEFKNRVSIHHMLLFIDLRIRKQERNIWFQYITCYSLSGCATWPFV